MCIRDRVFAGTRLRSALSLRSAAFTVDYDAGENAFAFTTHGYGHGVGLSLSLIHIYHDANLHLVKGI